MLPILQRVQLKRLLIAADHFITVEMYLEALLKERSHRIAQKTRQLAQVQRRVLLERCQLNRRQHCLGNRMNVAPLMGIGEQTVRPRQIRKVRRAKGLQRVFQGQSVNQRLRILLATAQSPTGRQVIAQLPDQNRWHPLTVVADIAPHPTDIQLIPGRQ